MVIHQMIYKAVAARVNWLCDGQEPVGSQRDSRPENKQEGAGRGGDLWRRNLRL